MSFVGGAAVAVRTCISSFMSSVASFVAVFAVVAVLVVVVACAVVHKPGFGAVLFAGKSVAAVFLGCNVAGVADFVVRTTVPLGAVIMAFTAAMLVFILDVFSRHFFLWLRLPCPGPGMLSIGLRGKCIDWFCGSAGLVLWFYRAGSVVLWTRFRMLGQET